MQPRQFGALFGSVILVSLIWRPVPSSATDASALCAANADPCTVTQSVAVTDGSIIDVGNRELRIASGGSLNVGSGTMTLRAKTLTVASGGSLNAKGTTRPRAARSRQTPKPSPSNGQIKASGAPGGTVELDSTGVDRRLES